MEHRGWNSLFRDKAHGKRVQGMLTPRGGAKFEQARDKIRKVTKRRRVSDADVIEWLAYGDDAERIWRAQLEE